MELWVSLFIAGELDQAAFRGPFQLKRFSDSMTFNTYHREGHEHFSVLCFVTFLQLFFAASRLLYEFHTRVS